MYHSGFRFQQPLQGWGMLLLLLLLGWGWVVVAEGVLLLLLLLLLLPLEGTVPLVQVPPWWPRTKEGREAEEERWG